MIELLVVVAIMAIISGTLVSFSRIGHDQVTLYVEASKVIDVILRSKSLAISAYRDPDVSRVTCAHGLSIDLASDPGKFSLNRYLKKLQPDPSIPVPLCANIGSSTSIISNYDRVVAERGEYVLSRNVVFDASETTAADIVFRPPDPQIYFFAPDGTKLRASSSSIVVKNKNGSGRIRITVGQGGQVAYNFID